MSLSPVPYGALFFAPMEGITDESFRKTILKLYPEWDYLACDFLRVPSAGRYPVKHLVRHFGKDLIEIPWVKEKTLYQILTSHTAFTEQMVTDLGDLGIPWVDVNLGCPSKQVCGNGGGSSLLRDLDKLAPLMRTIRRSFKGRLTAKIRLGFSSPDKVEDIVKLLNDEGIEMITVHGRTREMMYKEPAIWSYITKAVRASQVPVIGNGDVWEAADIDRLLKETGCHAVMVARGALKFPWMAQDYRRGEIRTTDESRITKMKSFFTHFREELESNQVSARGLLKQGKSVSRFMCDGLEGGEAIRRRLVLSQTAPEFFAVLDSL